MATRIHHRTCPLCEATCGLEIAMSDGSVASVKGDSDDVFSKGFICPKGTAVKHLHEDPDRLRQPMARVDDEWRVVSWDEAFQILERGLKPILDRDRDSVALYVGNPTVHSLSATVLTPALVKTLGSKNFYSAATVDQMPKHVSAGLMFGRPETIPVPDIDRTDFLLVLGANPWISNGSLATAPDFRGRLEAIGQRGGKVVVVDPRRTETAAGAAEHIRIRPGTDALLLMGIVHTLFAEDLVTLGDLAPHVNGLASLQDLARPFKPEAVAAATGIEPDRIRDLAREIALARSAGVYDRVGAHQQEFGTLASWASDVITTITGNLDRPGGKMFPYPAHSRPDPDSPGGRGWRTGRFHSRVKGYPEVFGQLPVATLADEIETPGEGRVRALITLAGNPVLSTPNGRRLAGALESLEFMVAIDPYLNETTRSAHLILPPNSILARHHYDFAFYGLSVRNVANYSPPLVPADGPDEWEIISRLVMVCSGQDVTGDAAFVPQMIAAHLAQQACGPTGSLPGRSPDDILRALAGRSPIEQIVDLRLRAGPYGDLFGANPDGLSLDVLEENPHGMDLGPLQPRLPNALRTASGKIELVPDEIAAEVPNLEAAIDKVGNGLVLIGRRQLRSNNSWMHNVPRLMGGTNRCTLMVNPEDAARLGLSDGGSAQIGSRVGKIEAEIKITDEMMPGVVSLPHGWGHDRKGSRLSVAADRPGVSANDLTDETIVDRLSGNAVLNGVPVEVAPSDA